MNTTYSDRTIAIERQMLKSEAYRSLTTGAAHVVLMTFLLKRQMKEIKHPKRGSTWEVVNDGSLVYSYAEARRQGILPARFRDAIDLLLDRGFIRIVKTGHGKHQSKTFYGLSDGWKTWKAGDTPKAIRTRRASSRGPVGFQPGNQHWKKRFSSTVKNPRSATVENTRSLVTVLNSSSKNTRSSQR